MLIHLYLKARFWFLTIMETESDAKKDDTFFMYYLYAIMYVCFCMVIIFTIALIASIYIGDTLIELIEEHAEFIEGYINNILSLTSIGAYTIFIFGIAFILAGIIWVGKFIDKEKYEIQ